MRTLIGLSDRPYPYPLTRKASEIFRDCEIDGNPESGVHHVEIAEVQLWFAQVQRALLEPRGTLNKASLREWGATIEMMLFPEASRS